MGATWTDALGPSNVVVSNWEQEAERFAPDLPFQFTMAWAPVVTRSIMVESSDIVVTTYSLVGRDKEDLERTEWHRVVLDEAQYIKILQPSRPPPFASRLDAVLL